MAEEDRQNQLAELEALQSALRNGRVKKKSDWDDSTIPIEGLLQIDFDDIEGEPIEFRGQFQGQQREFVQFIKFLPPIHMEFTLPVDYPSVSAPKLVLNSIWMTKKQLTACQAAVDETCAKNDGMMVLHFCHQSVVETVTGLNIEFINLNRAAIRIGDPLFPIRDIRSMILNKLRDMENEKFSESGFFCKICFENVQGSNCYKLLPCEHVFCKVCVSGYCRNIAESMITGPMKCVEVGCDSEVDTKIIKEALGDELYSKYDEALLQIAIRDPDTMECARELCHMPAYVTDRRKNLVECSYCGYSFCMLCKQTYHGVNTCKLRKEELAEIVKLYQEGDDNDREILCKKYGGAARMEEIINMYLNAEWIVENTQPCPSCRISIEKRDGCNKMQCTGCGVTFCWLCNIVITNGYGHFNEGRCDGRLFEGM